jgi:hypothetical protein
LGFFFGKVEHNVVLESLAEDFLSMGWAVSWAILAFFFVDFQQLESRKAMGTSEV